MLLHLTKKSHPYVCNVVREHSKCMDKASKGRYLEMLRVVKFVIDTKNNTCLRIRPEFQGENWSLYIFCNIDWDGVSETRISVTNFILYLMNVPICWRSKAQKGVSLLSREAEYVSMSEAVEKSGLYTTYSKILEQILSCRLL